jgi:hypothetical protein
LALVTFLGFTSCSTETVAEDSINSIEVPVAPEAKQIEIEIMELINQHRILEGLNPLNDHRTVKAVLLRIRIT